MSWSWPARLLGPALDAIVEGAWLAALYSGLEIAIGGGQTYVAWPVFMLAAGIGVLIGRRRLRSSIPLIFATLIAGALGWLAHPSVREAAFSGHWASAVPFHLAGWLVGAAVVRGAVHDDPDRDDLVVSTVLRWGIPVLLVPWLAASGVALAARERFIDEALPPTLLFVCAGLLAIGVSRLETIRRESGPSWQGGRGWWALLGSVVAAFAGLALFAGLVLGRPIGTILAAVLRPVVVLASYVIVAAYLVLSPFIALVSEIERAILQAAAPSALPAPVPSPVPVTPGPGGGAGAGGLIVVLLFLFVIAIGIGLALRQRPQRRAPKPAQVPEERTFVMPKFSISLSVPRFRWAGFRRAPTDASDAYTAALHELEHLPALARVPSESPAAHARRLRSSGVALPALWRLAADYQLERFGGVALSAGETGRAVERWRLVRSWVRSGRGRSSGSG